eukprot:TRINITY_DN649_c0_g2_i1.p1 TRINITY_DN649_c0_g2~~TRINITY_DN649_c0_g2_i1.p1  ORF type:complete len:295 (-),score=55.62 TRINITY_DN649_c0_g2_i1:104-988(-)
MNEAASKTAQLKVLSWNILDDEYCMKHNSLECLENGEHIEVCEWHRRLPLVIAEILRNQADIIILQEVSPHMFVDLHSGLQPFGYDGVYDGEVWTAATFWRQPWDIESWKAIAEEPPHLQHQLSMGQQALLDTSHFFRALSVAFRGPQGQTLLCNNIHTDWRDGIDVRKQQVHRAFQLGQKVCSELGWRDVPTVLAGDFNTDTKGLDFIYEAPCSLQSAYFEVDAAGSQRFTYSSTQDLHLDKKCIDGIFHSGHLTSKEVLVKEKDAVMSDSGVIPNAQFPSDHLPIACKFVIS